MTFKEMLKDVVLPSFVLSSVLSFIFCVFWNVLLG